MNIDEYTKQYDLPEMKLLGEVTNFKYYIKKDIPSGMQLGIPMVISENKKTKTFEVCNANQAMDLISYFLGENKNED